VDYGLWIMNYGLWIMNYGLWIMDEGEGKGEKAGSPMR
jgi:hypothetical protein